MNHVCKSNFAETIDDEVNHKHPPTNQATQMTSSSASNNISCDFSGTTTYTISNISSYTNLVRRRRNQRRLRHGTINTYTLNLIRQLRQRQNTNNPFASQIYNGASFR
ncbi:hypothetical protein GLOIN_2v1835724 [Rhizophagus clarus]|uniref:Uncharacterized protein n=1 Tax=Rhizophagus clarus TaxID=94130 RepID=A0A8H3LC47_9GLOM|nr:hypothetical protein GLOIN_2v1835724 [Rhizophagus clarus]